MFWLQNHAGFITLYQSVRVVPESWEGSLQAQATQGNYTTQDSSGMCHLMPRRHLPEWREEDERAFVHCGSSAVNHAITLNWVCHRAFQSVICHFIVTCCKLQLKVAGIWYPTATVYKCPLIILSPLWQMPLRHQVAHATAIPSGIISLCRARPPS